MYRGDVITPTELARRTAAGRGGYALYCSQHAILDCYDHAQSGHCLASMANSPSSVRDMLTDSPVRANARLCIGQPFAPDGSRYWRACLVSTRRILPDEEILVPYSEDYVYPDGSSPPASDAPEVIDLVTPETSPQSSQSATEDLQSTISAEGAEFSTIQNPSPPAPPPQPPPYLWRPPPPTQPRPPQGPPPTLLRSAAHPRPTIDPIAQFRVRRAVDRLPILQSPSVLSPADRNKLTMAVAQANECLRWLPVAQQVSSASALAFLTEAQHVCSSDFGASAAVAWAENFQFDPALLARDLRDFRRADSSLSTLARTRQAARAPQRLSVTRIRATFGPGGPESVGLPLEDYNRLLHIAEFGVHVFTPPQFVPCATPAPLRLRYQEVHCAIHRLLHKQMLEGTVLVLPLEAVQSVPGVHLQNSQHWTTKKGKAQGRAIADLSNTQDPLVHCPLNGHSPIDKAMVATACVDAYGPITHPTLTALILMILASADRFGWDNVVLWKMDLQGAFNLLWFDPASVPLLAFPLMFGLVVIHLVGLFGWAGMPHAFHVLTRALDALIKSRISGSSAFYVDDLMACSAVHLVEADRAIARDTIVSLAGPDALARDKDEIGVRLDFIGWQICLSAKTVTMSRRNLLKTCHAFFCFQIGDKLPRLLLQRMSSLAVRLSQLCPVMRPYTSCLGSDANGFSGSNPSTRHTLSALALCDIAMWRAFLLLLNTETLCIVRPLQSFRESAPAYAVEYDASLTGLAAGISSVAADGSHTLLRFAAVPVPFATRQDSSYQNTCEFLAALLGLLLAHSLDLSHFRYRLIGDSRASLAWSLTGRASSLRARRANVSMSLLLLRTGAILADTVHVPGVDNKIYDGLSRDETAQQLGLNPTLQLHLPTNHPYSQFLHLCDPALPLSSPEDHFTLSSSLLLLLDHPV